MTPATQEFLTSRSRSLNWKRCPRARYNLDERDSHGYEPVRVALPLATGGSTHRGLASLLRGVDIEQAVLDSLATYEHQVTGRGLDLGELESQSFVYNEQRALTEALVRMAGLRTIPRLLETYEVLEVEVPDQATLYESESHKVTWRSIPDALLRNRQDGSLYILSWKTCAEYSPKTDDDARVDMQGLSEAWALEQRLVRDQLSTTKMTRVDGVGEVSELLEYPNIRGIQMVYLVKGQRRAMAKESMVAQGLTADQISQGAKLYKTASPLIYGYQDDSFPPRLAWSSEWRCSSPHPMRKSQWYPSGECPGDGRNHKRGDNWKSFPVWETLGVSNWIHMLASGAITPEAGDPLESGWAIPVPNFRTISATQSWLRQIKSEEARIARNLAFIRHYEQAVQDSPGDDDLREAWEARLDEDFPQSTEMCNRWFGRKCPSWEICHGPSHVSRDPLSSGLYQIKSPAPQWDLASEAAE